MTQSKDQKTVNHEDFERMVLELQYPKKLTWFDFGFPRQKEVILDIAIKLYVADDSLTVKECIDKAQEFCDIFHDEKVLNQ